MPAIRSHLRRGRPFGALGLAAILTIVDFCGPVAGRAAQPTGDSAQSISPAPTVSRVDDSERLLYMVMLWILSAQSAQLSYQLDVPKSEPFAYGWIEEGSSAIREARAVVGILTSMDPEDGAGPPSGCCSDLADRIERYDQEFTNLVDIVERRGDESHGLIGEAHAEIDRLEDYLDQLESEGSGSGAPSGRGAAIRTIRADIDAIRRSNAEYFLDDDPQRVDQSRERVQRQARLLDSSSLENNERVQVTNLEQTYLNDLERIASLNWEVGRARVRLYKAALRIRDLALGYVPAPVSPTFGLHRE